MVAITSLKKSNALLYVAGRLLLALFTNSSVFRRGTSQGKAVGGHHSEKTALKIGTHQSFSLEKD